MEKLRILLVSTIAGGILLSLAGCAGSAPATSTPAVDARQRMIDEARKNTAMLRFIDGCLYETKGQYAEAILEFQEALMYDRSPAILHAIAKDYMILGKQSLAMQYAREAADMNPGRALFHETLAEIYAATYQTELAIAEYEAVIRIDSTNSQALYNLARMLQSTKPLRALEIYNRLLDMDGEQWEVLLQCADIYTNLGKFDKVAETYTRMLQLDPGNRELLRQLAVVYVRAGKFPEAIATLEQLLERSPDDAETLATLAETYMEQGKYDRALELYQRLLLRHKDNNEIKLRIGVAYFGQIQKDSTFIERAEAIFRDLVVKLPEDWRPHFYLGAIAGTRKIDSVAAYHFGKVTELAKWNPDGWYYLGSVYFEKNNYTKAVEVLEQAITYVKKDARIYFLLGLSYQQLDNKDEAIRAYRQSLAINPSDVNTIGSLALLLDGMRRFSESDSLYEAALKIDPRSHIILNNYGYSLSERGLQLQRALQMAKIAVEQEPNNASYLDTYGWIYYQLGEYALAEQYIARSIAAGDASAVVYEHYGDVHARLGNKEKAREYWRRALEKDPNNLGLKSKLERGEL